jgi:hypothetical protein
VLRIKQQKSVPKSPKLLQLRIPHSTEELKAHLNVFVQEPECSTLKKQGHVHLSTRDKLIQNVGVINKFKVINIADKK